MMASDESDSGRGSNVLSYGVREGWRVPWKKIRRVAIILAGACVVLVAVYRLALEPRLEQWKCANGMRNIGWAIQMYQQDYRRLGVNAPDLPAVCYSSNAPWYLFSCPAGGEIRAPIGTSNRYSYIYVGASVPVSASAHAIWMLEDPANHGMRGGNVLYADGSIDFLELPQLMQAFMDLQAGRNPPVPTTSLDRSAAREEYRKNWAGRMMQLRTGVWAVPTSRPAGEMR